MSADSVAAAVAGLARGRLEPGALERHVAALQQAAGAAGRGEVTRETVQALARGAGQPSQLVKQLAGCSGVPQLPGMVHLLEKLAAEPEVAAQLVSGVGDKENLEQERPRRRLVGGASAKSFNSPDLRTLRERLLTTVAQSSAQPEAATAGRRPGLLEDRPLLTANFVVPAPGEEQARGQHSVLQGVPAASQESLLLQELLYVLVGCGGSHIVPTRGTAARPVTFTLDPDIDPSLRALLGRVLPLAGHYSAVVGWCEDGALASNAGLVNQALGAALEELLHDYRLLVCQLEKTMTGGGLTLHQLWFHLQGSLHSLELLDQLVTTIAARQTSGGATLAILHDSLVHCSGNPKSEKILQFLIDLAAKPFFETLSKWLYRGVIIDPGRDFFVEDHEVVGRSTLPAEYNDDYWEKRYCLRVDRIPTFLHRYADTILRTGKYLNVIQQCDKAARWPELVPLSYLPNPEHYQAAVQRAHTFASTTLLQLLVEDRDLIGHLKSVKKYFLIEQGDFICQFLDLCEPELSQPVDCVEPARLESLLELSARTSAANSDPYKDNLRVALLPYDLSFQMGKIQALNTVEEGEFQTCDTSLLSGMDAFAFGYEVEWPVSLVLNHKALAQYQMLFRHFFYCKHIERLLSAVWITNKQTKFLPVEQFKVYHPSFALRQKMLNLIQNLSYYMSVEVVEPAWHTLATEIAGCSTVDEVLAKHGDFLNCCLHDCLLSSPQLLATVKKLLGVCSDFAVYMQSLGGTCGDSFTDDITRYDLQFSSVLFSLLDRISQLGRDNYNEKVLNVLHRLDFNGFYTTAIDQFKADTV